MSAHPLLILGGNSIKWQSRSCFHTFPVQRGSNLKARKQKTENIWNISAWLNQPFQPVTMGGHGEGSNSTKKVALAWQEIVLPNSRTTPNKLRRSISGLKSKQVPSPEHVPLGLACSFITGEKVRYLINPIMLFYILLLLSPLPIISLFSLLGSPSKMYPGPA